MIEMSSGDMSTRDELKRVKEELSARWSDLQTWAKEQDEQLRSQEGRVGSELALALHIEAYNMRRQDLVHLREMQLSLEEKLKVADERSEEEDKSSLETVMDQAATRVEMKLKPVSQLAAQYFVERKGSNSRKWDGLKAAYGNENLLPMWVADMDFAIAEPIQRALQNKCVHAAFGYSLMLDSYYQAVSSWYRESFAYQPAREWFCHAPGAMTAVHWTLDSILAEDEGVLVSSPLYPPLFEAAKILGRPRFDVPMLKRGNEDGSIHFSLDFAGIEKKLQEEKIKCILLCSPQNPVGRVWTKEELLHLAELAEKYDLLLLVDEIHQDLIASGYSQQAILALAEGRFAQHIVSVSSASKSFNLAGFPLANFLVPNEVWRRKIQAYIAKVYLGKPDTLAVLATETAYREGGPWLQDIKEIIEQNRIFLMREFLCKNQEIRWANMEGTYLAFFDLGARVSADKIRSFMLEGCKIAPSFGIDFGKEYGTWIRLNLATSPEIVREAVTRLQTGWDFLCLQL